jgi:prepilin-type N-terminal cleavage/methylation domain-containing protein
MKVNESGLTLIEIVVVVAILLILAAAVAPSLIGSLDRTRAVSAVDQLQDIIDAMSEMRKDQQDWPGRVSHMATPITTSDKNVCGANYTAGRVNNWAGPYLDRSVPSSGLPIAIGVMKDTTYRSDISGTDALLTLEIINVSQEDALAVNTAVDNDGAVAGRTIGTVRWSTSSSEGLVTMYYYRPIRGC